VIERESKQRWHGACRKEEHRRQDWMGTGEQSEMIVLSPFFQSSTHPMVQIIFEKGRAVSARSGGRTRWAEVSKNVCFVLYFSIRQLTFLFELSLARVGVPLKSDLNRRRSSKNAHL